MPPLNEHDDFVLTQVALVIAMVLLVIDNYDSGIKLMIIASKTMLRLVW